MMYGNSTHLHDMPYLEGIIKLQASCDKTGNTNVIIAFDGCV